MKNLLLALVFFPLISFGQNVNIPDANFKAYLVGNYEINTNRDKEIQIKEAGAFNGVIDCRLMNINNLKGIESFTALTNLKCGFNSLTSLDVSKNNALTGLDCAVNQLMPLDLSNNVALTELSCFANKLKNLDVSKNTALTNLVCSKNQLTSLDVSKNTALTNLYCSDNQITSLDVCKNTALTILDCDNNQFDCGALRRKYSIK